MSFSVCVQKVEPQTPEYFCSEKTLGTNSVPTCVRYKSRNSGCNLCSSDKALNSAQEERAHSYYINCKFEASLGIRFPSWSLMVMFSILFFTWLCSITTLGVQGTRLLAYTYRLGNVIRWFLDSCCQCKSKRKQASQQSRGQLPSYKFCPTLPIQNISINQVGYCSVRPNLTSKRQLKAWASFYLIKSRFLYAEVVLSIGLVIKGFKFCFSVNNFQVQFSNKAGTSFMGAKFKAQREIKQNSWDTRVYGFSANWVFMQLKLPRIMGRLKLFMGN